MSGVRHQIKADGWNRCALDDEPWPCSVARDPAYRRAQDEHCAPWTYSLTASGPNGELFLVTCDGCHRNIGHATKIGGPLVLP